eukprot:scaffold391_cov189-Alexandrium_tamarense.AAC.7
MAFLPHHHFRLKALGSGNPFDAKSNRMVPTVELLLRLKPRLEMDVTVDGGLHPNQHHLPLMLFMIGIAGRLRWFRMVGVVIDVYEID